eukprot:GHVL01023115.1.p1 GENE.GHVL01023115.1~~GHVL01023115.1.p1  ORF type:complete len:221 (+),score=41.23 GHVL01023115.1:26-688(+)
MSYVQVDVTHNALSQSWPDLRLPSSVPLINVKEKLYRHTGTPVECMELYEIKNDDSIIFLLGDHKSLIEFGVEDGSIIHVKNINENAIHEAEAIEDVSKIDKYEISEDSYNSRNNSIRKIKENLKIKNRTYEDIPEKYFVGLRCEVYPGGRRGEIGYIGEVSGTKGSWIGVKLDEPLGTNDGCVRDREYFKCNGSNYGCFVRYQNCSIGDYPVLDPFADI